MTLQCGSCDVENIDSHGYSPKAKRRLTNEQNGMVQDIDNGQWFKVKKVKGGKRIVPQFKGRIDWKSGKGFAAICVILSCLGAEGEYVLWDVDTSKEMTEKEWRRRKFGKSSKPSVWHRVCKEVVTSTSLGNLKKGQSIGCSCNSNMLNHWRHRRTEVVAKGVENGFEVLTTEEEWVDKCDGNKYFPKLKCMKCKEVVTSTCLTNLQSGQSIGCSCHNKTEGKLRQWLENKYPDATINKQYKGPKTDKNGQTKFDFHLTFQDGSEVVIELDGPQHFWSDNNFYTNEACERDLVKEKWVIAKGVSVVRVLQEDVWVDKLDWQGWLAKSIEDARSGQPRVFIPVAPEYISHNSAYVQLRTSSD